MARDVFESGRTEGGVMARKGSGKRLEATAYHEAGHAVAAWWLDLPFKYVTINPDVGSLGHVMHNQAPKWFNPEIETGDRQRLRGERHIMAGFAGQIAEGKYRGRRPRYGMDSDNDSAVNMAMYFCGTTDTTEAFMHFCFLSSRDLTIKSWWAVKAVAKALLERMTLSRKEVKETIRAESARMCLKRHPRDMSRSQGGW
jgi:hypothetical protein